MKKHGLTLRIATGDDCKDIWRWRNCPKARSCFFDSKTVPWRTHKEWFDSKVNDKKTRIFIGHRGKIKIGVIRFDSRKNGIVVSVNLNPVFLGKGFGTRMIKLGTRKVLSETGHAKPLIAEIRKDNIISQRAFLKAGYTRTGSSRKGVIYSIEDPHE